MSIKITQLRFLLLLIFPLYTACFNSGPKTLPEGTAYEGIFRNVDDIKFLYDKTYVDEHNNRVIENAIFDEIFQVIAQSNRFILVDMFLFNAFKGKQQDVFRPLSEELTQALITQKQKFPQCEIIVITDPINTVYGGISAPHLERLQQQNIPVVITDLNKLRDSNPLYSSLWRIFFSSDRKKSVLMLPNPFGAGQVPLSSYLSLLNFKANHRKVLIGANDEDLTAIVSSANPHDGSSAHGNVGVKFSGKAVMDLIETEKTVLHLSAGPTIQFQPVNLQSDGAGEIKLRVITERAIKKSVVAVIHETQQGDSIDMAMFYLSERNIIETLIAAKKRGVTIRVLLDPNKDAFGREKNGIPNRQAGYELNRQGIQVKWCNTQGEQCHSKLTMVHRNKKPSTIILGSANFTRRNLNNFNLETNVEIQGAAKHPGIVEISDYFNQRWHSSETHKASVPYSVYQDDSLFRRWQYRMMEATGLSTF